MSNIKVQKLINLCNAVARNMQDIAAVLQDADGTENVEAAQEVRNEKNPEEGIEAPEKDSPAEKPAEPVSDAPHSLYVVSGESGTVVKEEEVRAVLQKKARLGKTPQVHALLKAYGSEHLYEIDPAKFGELLKAAEAL